MACKWALYRLLPTKKRERFAKYRKRNGRRIFCETFQKCCGRGLMWLSRVLCSPEASRTGPWRGPRQSFPSILGEAKPCFRACPCTERDIHNVSCNSSRDCSGWNETLGGRAGERERDGERERESEPERAWETEREREGAWEREIERELYVYRERDIEIESLRGHKRQKEIKRERERERQLEGERERQLSIYIERNTDTHTHTHTYIYIYIHTFCIYGCLFGAFYCKTEDILRCLTQACPPRGFIAILYIYTYIYICML